MTVVAKSARSSSTTNAAERGPPLLLIMGMSGTALHWGEPFLAQLRRATST